MAQLMEGSTAGGLPIVTKRTAIDNYLAKMIGNAIEQSIIYDNGTRVGIGTASPTFKLDVAGDGRFRDYVRIESSGAVNLDNSAKLAFGEGDGTDHFTITLDGLSGDGSGRLRVDSVSSANALVIERNGEVGIGTASPAYKLDVSGTGRFTDKVYMNVGSIYSNNKFQFLSESGTAQRINVGGIAVSNSYTDDSKIPTNGIYSKGDIVTDGKIGIGITSPIRRLDIVQIATNDTDGMVIRSSTTATNVSGQLWAGTGGFVIDAKKGDLSGSANLHLRTGGSDRMIINSDGTITTNGLITLSGDPTSNLHAVTKQYADAKINNRDRKASVKVASTANIALPHVVTGTATYTMDGITLATGDRVLLKNQTTTSQNGIYTVSLATVAGVAEVASLTISASATTAGNVTVTLNGVATNVAVLAGDTAIAVADKIRATAFTGWATGGTTGTATVTFTATATGTQTDSVYSAGSTGATGTMTTTTQGVTAQVTATFTRATDADSNAEVTTGMFCLVEQGTTNEDTGWMLTSSSPITVGTTGLSFVQIISPISKLMPLAGGTMTSAISFTATATGGTTSSTPTALSYGKLQSYGTFIIAGDTDGSTTESIIIASGYGVSPTSGNGLKIAYNSLTWKDSNIWHAGNDGASSGLDADLLDGQQGSYYDHRTYNVQTNFLGGGYVSGGNEKPNWFGSGKLKLQMLSSSNLGGGGTWNDVLWLSSYTGSDVKGSYGLIFNKYADEIGYARQAYDATSWGTYRKLWDSGNFDPTTKADATHVQNMAIFTTGSNNGEARMGRASDRLAGVATVQLGTGADRYFEVVDNAWTQVIFRAGMNELWYKGNNVWHAGNDGTGSGLDADLLDGKDSSAYAILATTNIFTTEQKFHTGTWTDPHVGTGYAIKATSISAGVLKVGANDVWHAGNFNPSDYQPKEVTSFSMQPSYVAVRTPSRTVDQYYEFWDSGVGWADIKARDFYAGDGAYKVWHAGNFDPLTKSDSTHTHAFSSLTSIPTTLSGYGITDDIVINTGTNSGSYSTALGVSTVASGSRAFATGFSSDATGNYSMAGGYNALASNIYTLAYGYYAEASGNASISLGNYTKALGSFSFSSGSYVTASTAYAHATGLYALAVQGETTDITTFTGQNVSVDNLGSFAVGDVLTVKINGGASTTVTVTAIPDTRSVDVSGATPNTNWKQLVKPTSSGDPVYAQGYNTLATGGYSHAQGNQTVASGTSSHAEGYLSKAIGSYSHAEGHNTKAQGIASHAEGYNTKAEGNYSHSEGYGTFVNSEYGHAEGYYTNAYGFGTHIMGKYGDGNSGSTWYLANGTSSSAKGLAVKIQPDGLVYADGSFNSTGADYAEMFEWADENINNEDRVGMLVTFDDVQTDKIRIAKSTDDYILGVVSGNPTVIGDNADMHWHGRFIYDEWGRKVYETVTHPAEYETLEDGTALQVMPEWTETRLKQNPDWDTSVDYTPRQERQEWDAIGLTGKLLVKDDGTCVAGGYCTSNDLGVATKSATGYRVMKRTGDNQVLILVR